MATSAIAGTVELDRESDGRYELVIGEYLELSPIGVPETLIASAIDQSLGGYVRQHGLGRVGWEILFRLSEDAPQRRPDVAFVSYGRWPRGRRVPRGNAWEVAPDLAVEVISPNDLAEVVNDKLSEYFAAGVRQVWHVFPGRKQVVVYRSPDDLSNYWVADVVEGGDVIPGFRPSVAELFPDETE